MIRKKKAIQTYLGIESCNGTSSLNVFLIAAYAESVRVYFSIASNAAHPRSRHTSFPVVRHIMKKLSIVCMYTSINKIIYKDNQKENGNGRTSGLKLYDGFFDL